MQKRKRRDWESGEALQNGKLSGNGQYQESKPPLTEKSKKGRKAKKHREGHFHKRALKGAVGRLVIRRVKGERDQPRDEKMLVER